jgi:hypothetical protein
MPDETDLQKHTLNLYRGDYDRLRAAYPDIGAATVIRRVVRKFVEKIEASESATDVDLSINI